MENEAGYHGSGRQRKTLILCFDGTGNKFQGNEGDSNILKIFGMLDQQDPDQYAYYQPGIGTYVESSALSKTSRLARFRSWYRKAKDSAVGTSFDAHVVGGYKFLMKYYNTGDHIYMFGFSRGAYTARFLAQMLDYVGLLGAGNEEMLRFAWKTFSKWQQRTETTEEEKRAKNEQYEFMKKFRTTFSRPISRIRFLGLFDTVNSVPRFENAWMSRTKFPYTARSSALVIRHAVSIDERRAKFRQDLMSQKPPQPEKSGHHHHHHFSEFIHEEEERIRGHMHHGEQSGQANGKGKPQLHRAPSSKQGRFKPHARHPHNPVLGPMKERLSTEGGDALSAKPSRSSLDSTTVAKDRMQQDIDVDEEDAEQDIQEIWFPGCHADIGGGCQLEKGEDVSLSHAPLIWMIREARKAGLPFDEDLLADANYICDELHIAEQRTQIGRGTDAAKRRKVPMLEVEGRPVEEIQPAGVEPQPESNPKHEQFLNRLSAGGSKGIKHDYLVTGPGVPFSWTVGWKVMEYLPFRRMDLRSDGSWQPIRWPLPMGETRDIPEEAEIHHSAIKRMEQDEKYRPGNLIVGGGGRGMRHAPKSAGVGEWKILKEEGDPVGEVVVRAKRPEAIAKAQEKEAQRQDAQADQEKKVTKDNQIKA